jgi:uncharacterized protein (UPF0332 family)
LKKEGRLELVEVSEEIARSYLTKADNCLKSAKLLLENDLFENSVSMTYYAMYNSLTALLFKTGVKCENHSGSIILLGRLFGRRDLYRVISFAKKERIDKQYYVDLALTKQSAEDLLRKAESFLVNIKLMMKNLKNEDIEKARNRFSRMTG